MMATSYDFSADNEKRNVLSTCFIFRYQSQKLPFKGLKELRGHLTGCLSRAKGLISLKKPVVSFELTIISLSCRAKFDYKSWKLSKRESTDTSNRIVFVIEGRHTRVGGPFGELFVESG